MKKTSEVGLSVRVVKGKVFLLKGGAVDLNEERIAFDLNDLIACSEQIGSFPLLVIEDGVKMLAEHSSEVQEATYTPQHKITYKHGFMDGYNKAKETYKFTEEDLKRVLEFWGERGRYDKEGFTCSFEKWWEQTGKNSIKSLTKKELWIEVEYDYEEHPELVGNPKEEWYLPKIINNQIKAVWK